MPAFKFFIDLHCRPHSRLYLSDSFAMAMVNRRLASFWLHVEGCPNGPSWVFAKYALDESMLLGKGWKLFARFHHLTRGQCLAFQFDGDQTLSVKIYHAAGGRVEGCAESESSSNCSCSYDEDEDEESSSDIKAEASLSSSRWRAAKW